jgi:hypothetical protein
MDAVEPCLYSVHTATVLAAVDALLAWAKATSNEFWCVASLLVAVHGYDMWLYMRTSQFILCFLRSNSLLSPDVEDLIVPNFEAACPSAWGHTSLVLCDVYEHVYTLVP